MEVEFYSPESLFIAKWKVGNPISITQVKEKKKMDTYLWKSKSQRPTIL